MNSTVEASHFFKIKCRRYSEALFNVVVPVNPQRKRPLRCKQWTENLTVQCKRSEQAGFSCAVPELSYFWEKIYIHEHGGLKLVSLVGEFHFLESLFERLDCRTIYRNGQNVFPIFKFCSRCRFSDKPVHMIIEAS